MIIPLEQWLENRRLFFEKAKGWINIPREVILGRKFKVEELDEFGNSPAVAVNLAFLDAAIRKAWRLEDPWFELEYDTSRKNHVWFQVRNWGNRYRMEKVLEFYKSGAHLDLLGLGKKAIQKHLENTKNMISAYPMDYDGLLIPGERNTEIFGLSLDEVRALICEAIRFPKEEFEVEVNYDFSNFAFVWCIKEKGGGTPSKYYHPWHPS